MTIIYVRDYSRKTCLELCFHCLLKNQNENFKMTETLKLKVIINSLSKKNQKGNTTNFISQKICLY